MDMFVSGLVRRNVAHRTATIMWRQFSSSFEPFVQRTVLSNGVKVVSQAEGPGWSSIVAHVRVCPRYEQGPYMGASLLAEMHGLQANKFQTTEEVGAILDEIGGDVLTQRTKEGFVHSVNFMKSDLQKVMNVIGKCVSAPKFTVAEVTDNLEATKFIRMDQANNSKPLVLEGLHKASFAPGPLSQLSFPEETDVIHLSAENVNTFYKACLQPEWVTIGAVGVDHNELCELVEKEFGHLQPSDTSILDLAEAKFVGGTHHIKVKDAPIHPAMHMPLAHIGIAMESVPSGREQYVYFVLQALLGGGSSFSAGGPGKGLHSRLYRNCLNKWSWVESAVATNMCMRDTGMFVLEASVMPEQAMNGYILLLNELLGCLAEISETEVDRARNQLKNFYLTGLESAAVYADNLARLYDRDYFPSPAEECAYIDEITGVDVNNAALALLEGPITIASYSNCSNLPTSESLSSGLSSVLTTMGVKK
eukprot:m.17783 g.17783  ORF g.17783 m.17783 type:complete len:477 (-) comp4838_c0_seq1:115-1545(-)